MTSKVVEELKGNFYVMTPKLNFKGVEYTREMVRSVKAPKNTTHLLSRVMVGDKTLWSFKDEQFKGLVKFEEINSMPFICFIKQEWKDNEQKLTLVRIIPFEDLHNLQRVMVNGEMQVITSRDIFEIIKLKSQLSKKLGADVEFSEIEKRALVILRQRKKEEEERVRLEKERLRQERIARIINRPQISGHTEDGSKKYGYPVVGDEWQILPERTFVVLVESYNNETGECGEMIEAFLIKRGKGGKPEKVNASKVFKQPVVKTKAVAVVPEVRVELFEIDGSIKPVVIHKDMEAILRAREAGLNGGTVVTIEVKDNGGRYQLYAVNGKDIKPIKNALPIGQ